MLSRPLVLALGASLLLALSWAAPKSSAAEPVETYVGSQFVTVVLPGTVVDGNGIRFDGQLTYPTLDFTPGGVAYGDGVVDFDGNEIAFRTATYNFSLVFPNEPGATVTAEGDWSLRQLTILFEGNLTWTGIRLGPTFSVNSFDVQLGDVFTSLVSNVLWQGSVVPELEGNIVSIDGQHQVVGNDPVAGTLQLTASGTIYAEPQSVAAPGVSLAGAVLQQNQPNPFHPTTSISFRLPDAARVDLSIFDLRGRRIATLARGVLGSGAHRVQWDGRDALGRRVVSGTYFYRLDDGQTLQTRRMTLVR